MTGTLFLKNKIKNEREFGEDIAKLCSEPVSTIKEKRLIN
jgi:hypothetical protein